ncbi:MAG: hypothetical protein JWM14_1427 [Chitinophagaceae bacterium]|nr:hypothetical protein [Chitinophagaceae bacterium]
MIYFLGINDLVFAPIYLFFIYVVIYFIAQKIRERHLRQYFLYGIQLKLAGAIIFGLIYAFIYQGADTYGYWIASKTIYTAFWDSPVIWFKLILHFEPDSSIVYYTNKIYWYRDLPSYFPSAVAGFFSIFCFNTYSVLAMCLAIVSFNGLWHLYLVFYNLYPQLHKKLAIAIFYIPSVFFWGSGLMKEPLVLAGLGWMVYAFYFGLIKRERPLKCILLAITSLIILFSVKPYVIAALFFPMMVWLYMLNIKRFKKTISKIIVSFLAISLQVVLIYFFLDVIVEKSGFDLRNSDAILNRIREVNEWIVFSTREEGSVYNIGKFDGTASGALAMAPQALIVALFRPFLWEVKNMTMFAAAIENTWMLVLTLYVFFKAGFFRSFRIIRKDTTLVFCFLYCLILAIIVGLSSGNFGTLVRYKIPLIPFYVAAIYILQAHANNKIASQVSTQPSKSKKSFVPPVQTNQ